MIVRAIFFDFGGTLASLSPELNEPWKVWCRVASERGVALDASEVRQVNREADRRFHDLMFEYHGRTSTFWRMRDTWMMERLGVEESKEAFLRALQQVFEDPAGIQVYPETANVLDELRARGLYLGVISNFTDGLLPILSYHRLSTRFDGVTYSQEAGVAKPDPRIFHRALTRAHCSPHESVHVGDSWESDYLGAKAVDMTPVLVNRDGRALPAGSNEIPDLSKLPDFVFSSP